MVGLRGISTFILALSLSACSGERIGDTSVTALSATRDGHGHDTSDGEKRIALDVSAFQVPDSVRELILQNSDCSVDHGSSEHFFDLAWLTSSAVGRATRVVLFRVPGENGCFDVYTINFGRSTDPTVNREVCTVNSVYQNLSTAGLRQAEIEWATSAPYGGENGPHCLNLPGGRVGRYIDKR